MTSSRDIIIRPLVTEKMEFLRENSNQYAFEVIRSANKIEIKRAIEDIYGVNVLKVRVMNRKAKKRRLGWIVGKTRSWRRAVVTLQEGESIDYFE
ncbi:MAG: 50S ribosomal protein L23 [bacterium]|nr:50S ribosomal protein L23 [bacterium]